MLVLSYTYSTLPTTWNDMWKLKRRRDYYWTYIVFLGITTVNPLVFMMLINIMMTWFGDDHHHHHQTIFIFPSTHNMWYYYHHIMMEMLMLLLLDFEKVDMRARVIFWLLWRKKMIGIKRGRRDLTYIIMIISVLISYNTIIIVHSFWQPSSSCSKWIYQDVIVRGLIGAKDWWHERRSC